MYTFLRTAIVVLACTLATACSGDDGTPFDPGISGNAPPATDVEVVQLVDLVNNHRSGMAGENIAWGTGSGDRAFDMWINSSGHRANIENCSYTHHGVGLADGRWTHLFLQNPTN